MATNELLDMSNEYCDYLLKTYKPEVAIENKKVIKNMIQKNKNDETKSEDSSTQSKNTIAGEIRELADI